jgi:hypothetical protein
MNAVITLGIDMSSQPKGTAACAVTWEADRAVTVTPCLGCDDEMLSEMIAKSDAVGIDAPFGGPAEFAVAVGELGRASGKRPDPSACDKGDLRKHQASRLSMPFRMPLRRCFGASKSSEIVMVLTINVERRGYLALLAKK